MQLESRKLGSNPGKFRSTKLAGNVVCSWGRGEDGQLGLGDAEDRPSPTQLRALDGQDIVSVTSGADHTTAFSESRMQVYSWGWYTGLVASCCPFHHAVLRQMVLLVRLVVITDNQQDEILVQADTRWSSSSGENNEIQEVLRVEEHANFPPRFYEQKSMKGLCLIGQRILQRGTYLSDKIWLETRKVRIEVQEF
ncbi:hypothetical protein RJ640_026116 [Escallonia rubra]|uniref:Uncharacterized protein n=1 Tax=Escallonia rubra TaxID=112253 RepID=A0AA88QI58_9ASTE|nr:hypothetical protein RJ640_026116 [Escallonia rubra]